MCFGVMGSWETQLTLAREPSPLEARDFVAQLIALACVLESIMNGNWSRKNQEQTQIALQRPDTECHAAR